MLIRDSSCLAASKKKQKKKLDCELLEHFTIHLFSKYLNERACLISGRKRSKDKSTRSAHGHFFMFQYKQ